MMNRNKYQKPLAILAIIVLLMSGSIGILAEHIIDGFEVEDMPEGAEAVIEEVETAADVQEEQLNEDEAEEIKGLEEEADGVDGAAEDSWMQRASGEIETENYQFQNNEVINSEGRIKIVLDDMSESETDNGYSHVSGVVTFNANAAGKKYLVTQKDASVMIESRLVLNADTDIKIRGVNMGTSVYNHDAYTSPIDIVGGERLELFVEGINYLQGKPGKYSDINEDIVYGYPGIRVAEGKFLSIQGDGELGVKGGLYCAGIGGKGAWTGADNTGTVLIKGNVLLKAAGGHRSAGIGGATNVAQASVKSGRITIDGGTVIATGGTRGGAGIGGGGTGTQAGLVGGDGGIITINGGTVIATGGAGSEVGTGIGGGSSFRGNGGGGGTITINGGSVITSSGVGGGAGIGSGVSDDGTKYGAPGTISINKSANVIAYSKDAGYAIQADNNSMTSDKAYVFQGNLNAAINQITNIDVVDIKTEEKLKTLELPAGYLGYAYTTSGESQTNYNLVSSAATGEELGIFAKTADNNIELQSINSFAKTPVKLVEYLVKGKLWHDRDRDGYIGNGETGVEGQKVTIEKYNLESDSYTAYKTVTTDSDGNYSAAVYPGKYRMKFPDLDEAVGVTKKTADIRYKNATESMANPDYYSDEFEIEATNVTDLPVIMNAGYLRPNTDNNLFFHKSVKDNDTSSYEARYGTDDLKETMQFKLEYTLPGDIACYYDLKLQDMLPDELELAHGDKDKAVKVYINGVPVAGTDGQLRYDKKKNIVTYQFYKKDDTIDGEYTPYSWLAGKTIRMEIEAVFNQDVPEEKIDTAVNKGEIVINEEIHKTIRITEDEHEEEVKAEVYLKGTIKGIAFLDMNKNGMYDNPDKLQQNLEVKLYDAEDDRVVDTKQTGTDGSYEFKVEMEKAYYIGMPKTSGPIALTLPQYANINGSHLAQDTGLSENRTAIVGERVMTVNGGYGLECDIPDFRYEIKDGTDYKQEKEVLEPSEDLEYRMTIDMPGLTDLEKYDTFVIQTILDEGLDLKDIAGIEALVSKNGMNTEALNDYGTFEYITADHKIFFTIDNNKIEDLADKTIEIKFSMKIRQNIVSYPMDGFVNKGAIIINGWTMYPDFGDPVAKVKGIISGEAFDERTNLPEAGVAAELYKEADEVFRYQSTVPTDSNGKYQFVVDIDADYKVKFPTLQGNKGLITPRSASGGKKASHPAVTDGYTPELHIDNYDEYLLDTQERPRADGSRYGEADAGYAEPDTGGLGFEKLVLNPDKGKHEETVTITDKNQKIEFLLTFKLPQDMEGYQFITLEDILPFGLVPYTGNKLDDVKVEILDKNGSNTNHNVYQDKLSLGNNRISYVLDAGTYVFADLAEHQLKMTVYAKLDPAITDYSDVKLVNKGNLTINKWEEEDGQEIGIKSKITGTLFDDDKVNRNGSYDTGEEINRTEPVTVILYPIGADGKPDESQKKVYGSTDGTYFFEVETGKSYMVEFLPILETDGTFKGLFTPRQVQVDVKDLEHVVDAGYARPVIDEEEMQFTKSGADGTSKVKITEAGEKISFDIGFYLPADLNGYQTMEIQDILPKELKPLYMSDVAEAATIKAYRDGDNNGILLSGEAAYSNSIFSLNITDLTALKAYAAGSPVYVVMTLETQVTEIPDGSITNYSKLIVNGDEKSKVPGDEGDDNSKVIIEPDTGKPDPNPGPEPEPDIDEQFINLKKQAVGMDGTYQDRLEVKDPADILRFAIHFNLPADLTGYKSIEIQDVLPADGSLIPHNMKDLAKSVTVRAEAGGETKELTGNISYSKHILSFYTEDIEGLEAFAAGRELKLTMEVILKLADKDGVYPSEIKNSGKLIINQDIEVDKDGSGEEPDIDIIIDIDNEGNKGDNTGIISGKTFASEGTAGKDDYVTVTLYKEAADGSYQLYKEVTVKLGDNYQFVVERDAAYKVQFSLQSGKAGLIEPGEPTDRGASHAGLTDGCSHKIVIDDENPEGFANAGYAYPEVDEEKIRLQKQVKNGGDYTDSAVLTDREQILSYRISFMVPEDIKGYQTIEIKDILPEQLEFAGRQEESVRVYIAGALTDKGELLGSGQEIIYTFRYREDFSLSELAGKEIYMEVDARLKADILELPKELTNKGVLTINGKEELGTKEPGGAKEPEEPELPGRGEFIKQLLGAEGKPVSNLELVNTNSQEITYLITYRTNSLEYYEAILLEDQLDNRFEYIQAKVVMNNSDITKAAGTLEYDKMQHKLSYQFKEPIAQADLSNQVITMEISVKLKQDITDYSDIHNNAKLLVNGGKADGGSETDTDNGGEPPVVEFAFGSIKGYVFIDENNDNLRDKGDTPVEHVAVQLEQWNGTEWVLVETTVTNGKGVYEFARVPYGQYRIKVLSGLLNMKHVIKQAGGNQFNGIGSDVNENGITEGFVLDSANKEWISAAGLEYKEDDEKAGGDKNGGKDDNGDEEVFMKLPSEEMIKPGETIDYVISGFGNTLGREMKKYSITDIFPAGLHFQSAKVPAFTKGTGITYEVSYITNEQRRKILHSDVPADKAFSFQAPELARGEYITDLTIRMDSVPDGFGAGDEIVYTCLVDENPPTQSLVNDAALGFDGKEIYAKNNALQVGGAPKTGDNFDIRAYSVIPILALFIAILCYRYGKRYQTEK